MKQANRKQIEKIKIKLPSRKHQPSVEELREEIKIPLNPDELMDLVVRDYEIEHEE